MCTIIVCDRKRIGPDLLAAAAEENPHGIGAAWIGADGIVRWRKGINLKLAKKLAARLPLPYLMHARIATVGGVSPELTHPFPVERHPRLALRGNVGRKGTILAHNGHIGNWRAIVSAVDPNWELRSDTWTDSRAMAHVVALLGAEHGAEVLAELDGQRFALIGRGGIERFGNWTKRDGVWLSTDVSDYGRRWTIGKVDRPFYGRYLPTEGAAYGEGDDWDRDPWAERDVFAAREAIERDVAGES